MSFTIQFIGSIKFDSSELSEKVYSKFIKKLSTKCGILKETDKSLWYINDEDICPENDVYNTSIEEYIISLKKILTFIDQKFPGIYIIPSFIYYKFSNNDSGGTIRVTPRIKTISYTYEQYRNFDWETTTNTIKYN